MKIEVITIGGEILIGRTLDTNFHFIARGLARLGVPPLWHTSVPDTRELLADALRSALARADGIIMSGGLGGTPDDITRRVLSQVLGRPLVLREEVLQAVEEIYRARGRTPPPSAQGMALLPQGAQIIPNPVGLAPGLLLAGPGGTWVCALPGVPEELRAQMEQFVLPLVERRLGGARGWEIVFRTAGVPETVLAEMIGTRHPEGHDVAYLPNWGGVDLRLIRKPEALSTREEFDAWVEGIRGAIGPVIYATGEATLEEVIGAALVERGLHVAVAESLTGGGVGAALTRVPGSSRYFLGSVTAYDDGIKNTVLGVGRGVLLNHGAVSGPVAEAMAVGARRLFGADLAVSTTGIAGPTGATPSKPVGLVYLGLSTRHGETHVRRVFPGRSREAVTARAVSGALLLLHRHLAGLSLETWERNPDAVAPGTGPGGGNRSGGSDVGQRPGDRSGASDAGQRAGDRFGASDAGGRGGEVGDPPGGGESRDPRGGAGGRDHDAGRQGGAHE